MVNKINNITILKTKWRSNKQNKQGYQRTRRHEGKSEVNLKKL